MKKENCYLEFDYFEDLKFEDLKFTFEKIKYSKNNSIETNDNYWLDNFPKYSIEKFWFLDSDLKPNFKTADKTEFNWHFYSLIELLSINYGIEYIDLKKVDKNKGLLEYNPYEYPYGGIDGIVMFVKSFNCIPKIIDDGTSVYEINFETSEVFNITDLEDENKQNSSVEKFNAVKLLYKFANRFKQ
nr:hypothetical protein [uncultured Flavobacterium sp.]